MGDLRYYATEKSRGMGRHRLPPHSLARALALYGDQTRAGTSVHPCRDG